VVKPTDIKNDVENVLRNARVFMSAYQILEELPTDLRDLLIKERGMPGQGSGHHFASASVVADAAEMLEGREIIYGVTRHLKFEVAGKEIRSGNEVCAFYRLQQ
jgi:hypothetical protein